MTVTGENFAPTPLLGCDFFAPSCQYSATDIFDRSTCSDGARQGAAPLFSTMAHFIRDTRVVCELPYPGESSLMLTVTVNLNEYPRGLGREQRPPGYSAAVLVYYDEAVPPSVKVPTSWSHSGMNFGALGRSTARPYLSIHENGIFIVEGSNFAPTGVDDLRCLYTPIDAEIARIEREALMLGHERPLESLQPPRATEEDDGSVEVPATYVSANVVRCPLQPGETPVIGDMRIRIAHSMGRSFQRGPDALNHTWSHTAALVSLYDASLPAEISLLELPYADRSVRTVVNVSGSNLAPTGENRLTCRFKSLASAPAEHAVNASFYSTSLVRCVAPKMDEGGTGEVGEYVQVRLSHDGDAAASSG